MEILGPILTKVNQFVVVMTDRFRKLTKAKATTKSNAATPARISFANLVTNYDIVSKLLTDNGP